MDECITISDDEDVQLLKHVVYIDKEPPLIDLTSSQETNFRSQPSPQPAAPPAPPPPTPCQQKQQQPQPQQHQPQPQQQPQYPRPPQQIYQPFPPPQQPQSATQKQFQSPPSTQQQQPTKQPPRQQPPSQPIPQSTPHSTPQSTPQPAPQSTPQSTPQATTQPEPLRSMPVPTATNAPKATVTATEPVAPQPPPQKQSQMSDYDLMMAQKALGNEKYKHNLFDDAIRIYKRANELARKLGDKDMSAILHFNLAMTYYKVGSFDQSADECANAVKINDKYIKAHLKRAEIYQRQGKFEEAVICYEHICELDNTNPDYVLLLNHAKEKAKQPKKKDYYQLLGLRYDFTREDLKKAYRQQALSHHPDRHSDADVVTRRIEEKRFKEASEAHSYIKLRMGYRL